jgi:hypothetical protein
MKKIRAFTYKPKIKGVRNGTIRQTIRPVHPQLGSNLTRVGDGILFHGWEGKPYRSKWSWRLDVTVKERFSIMVLDGGIVTDTVDGVHRIQEWNSDFCNELARLDGIDPPTGRQLRRVFEDFYGDVAGMMFEVIRW